MGSTFSIENDTDDPVWVNDELCASAVAATKSITSSIVSMIDGADKDVKKAAMDAYKAAKVPITSVNPLDGLNGSHTITDILDTCDSELVKTKDHVVEELAGYTKLPPGTELTVKGTLSLVKSVYCTKNNGDPSSRSCWTGPTDGSNHVYPVSEYF